MAHGIIGFLEKNKNLIFKFARLRFGKNFNVDEVMSDAALAYYRMVRYHKQYKRTKDTSSFSWFLKKEFDKSSRIGVTTDNDHSPSKCNGNADKDYSEIEYQRLSNKSHDSVDEQFLNDQALFLKDINIKQYDVEDDALGEDEECNTQHKLWCASADSLPYGQRYLICRKSFRKGILSSELFMTLRALSDKKTKLNLTAYQKLLNQYKSEKNLIKAIQERLFEEVIKSGYGLYVGVCLNGTLNYILCAAKSREEANIYLANYGNVLETRQLNPSNHSA